MFAQIAQAQVLPEGDGYVMLEPLPNVEPKITSYGDYFSGVYSTALTLTVVLAVIMIVIGGIQYSASWASPGGKGEAKSKIWSAIGGLLLALLSFMILRTINPQILKTTAVGIGGGGGGKPGGGGGGGGGGYGGPSSLTDDDGREQLQAGGIDFFDLKDCEQNGFATPCGYFQGIDAGLVDYMDAIGGKDGRCPECSLVARDGTGPGHTKGSDHYLGKAIDLAPTDSVNDFVKNNPDQFTKVGEVTKVFDGQTFTWPIYEDKETNHRWMFEDYPGNGKDHWHVSLED